MPDSELKKSGIPLKDEKKRLKEFLAIDEILNVLNQLNDPKAYLQQIANIIPKAFDYKENISVCITYNRKKYKSSDFHETQWFKKQSFETPDRKKGVIEIFFSKKYSESENANLDNELTYLQKITTLISGALAKNQFENLLHINTERVKELKGISRATDILNNDATLEDSLQQICNFLPEAWQYPEYTCARIVYDNKVFTSDKFKKTTWFLKKNFLTPDNKKGVLEIYYLKKFPQDFEGPFQKEERELIDNLAALISGIVSKKALQSLLINNTERLKELKGMNQTSRILKQSKNLDEALQVICTILPQSWQYPEFTAVRIVYDNVVFSTPNYIKTPWIQKQDFEAPGNKKGSIEIYYLKEFPEADEGPFLKEERNLLKNLAHLIAGSATKDVFKKLHTENKERLKELWALNQTSKIIEQGKPVDETLQKICDILPKSWQYPEDTVVRIKYEGKTYTSRIFDETIWAQKEYFNTIDDKLGSIEIYYLKEYPKFYEGPFLREERFMLINIGKLICGYLNDLKGREIFREKIFKEEEVFKEEELGKSLIENKQPHQLLFDKQFIDKYIYLDMMKYKLKEILFVSTLYDAFILENEDNFFEQFMGEIYEYSLLSMPKITCVSSDQEALELLKNAHFDLVILMVGVDNKAPFGLSEKIKEKQPSLPVYLLLNKKSNIKHFENLVPDIKSIDDLFVWDGNSQIFFAIVKSIEDRANLENDTRVGLVRIILLIEDSSLYYSKYLQMFYSIVFERVKKLLSETKINELDTISKMRSRPKIIHVKNYEDALYIFNKYKEFLLCVISDVEFQKDNKHNKKAGIEFISYIKSQIFNIPVILQSAEPNNIKLAKELQVGFINKNSENLLNDLKEFFNNYFGFGDFIFRDKKGHQLAVARTLREFEEILSKVPEESIYLHAMENQFSLWLMARGEVYLAKTLNPMRISDFETIDELRNAVLDEIRRYKEDRKKGKVLRFDETYTLDEKNIVSLAGGSFGGKGRGLAFIDTLIYNLDLTALSKKINIRTPITVVIGTDEFDRFIESNNLGEKIYSNKYSYNELKQLFIKAHLSPELLRKLRIFVKQLNKPIVVRSSSFSENTLAKPFTGVFDTYIVPNELTNDEIVLNRLAKAIKLVYASVYSDISKTYFSAINSEVEGEKMAVILQELVGNRFENYYYPHISGVAQSYNYYPVANMKAEEGFAVIAFGLGSYVVEGWKSYRFTPKYPKIEMFSTKDLLNSSQVKFYALDCSKKEIDYLKDGELASLSLLDIREAEKHGTLNHCVSVYNPENDTVEMGLHGNGPRVMNFSEILRYNYIPLAETLETMLETIKDALGSPVEIEYAVDLTLTENNLPSFYLLQIKPLTGYQLNYDPDFSKIDRSKMILFTKSSLGNGENSNIKDVIFIDINKFDKMRTYDMVSEIEAINQQMINQKKHYILIGPGRWGTRDPFLGVPVIWSQISNAKVIVEISLPNFPLDSSLGSHFFHNVTSMNIGYFSVLDTSQTDFIKWDILNKQTIVNETKYFKHIQFEKPLTVLMNGRQKTAVIVEDM